VNAYAPDGNTASTPSNIHATLSIATPTTYELQTHAEESNLSEFTLGFVDADASSPETYAQVLILRVP
jgi:hypothetical protein